MKSTDNPCHPSIPANPFGLLNDVADAAVGASGDDISPRLTLIGERRVVDEGVWNKTLRALHEVDGHSVFEIKNTRDLSQVDKPIRQPVGLFGQGQSKNFLKFGAGHTGADIKPRLKLLVGKGIRMGNELSVCGIGLLHEIP
ncbi:hypothetical protein SDC9_80858 [bioreactor metagenome]|uniref:Uncharacterized protein n=1 Tax=bioreactor metagenome TaxID=1076179 RepID=A0A644Z0C2_9ZZZZ